MVSESDKGGVSIGGASLWALNNRMRLMKAEVHVEFEGLLFHRRARLTGTPRQDIL